MIGMWALGWATALTLDAVLFDNFPLWQGVPILAGLTAMTVITMRRHNARRDDKEQP